MQSQAPDRRRRAAVIVVPLVAALVLTLFAWPAARLEPRDLPVGVAGPDAGARAVEQRLEAADGDFDVRRYPDEAAAAEAIADREIYGAVVATPAGTRTLTATAAGPTVAQLLRELPNDASASTATVDVVPATDDDPRGLGLSASALPLVLAGMLAGTAAAFLAPAGLRRVGLIAAISILAGLAATAIVQGWLGVIGGDWTANWAALSLTVLSIGPLVAGLEALLGRAGIGVAAALMVVVGNAFSAMSSAPEMLPWPAGAIGQLLPPGAGGNLLRSTGFFDGARAGEHIAVLAAWSLLGLAALLVAVARNRPRAVPAAVPAAQAPQPSRSG